MSPNFTNKKSLVSTVWNVELKLCYAMLRGRQRKRKVIRLLSLCASNLWSFSKVKSRSIVQVRGRILALPDGYIHWLFLSIPTYEERFRSFDATLNDTIIILLIMNWVCFVLLFVQLSFIGNIIWMNLITYIITIYGKHWRRNNWSRVYRYDLALTSLTFNCLLTMNCLTRVLIFLSFSVLVSSQAYSRAEGVAMEDRDRAISEGREAEQEAVAIGKERVEEDKADLIRGRMDGYYRRGYGRGRYDRFGYDDYGWRRDGYNRDGYHRYGYHLDDYGRHLWDFESYGGYYGGRYGRRR